ncbi:MAG: hypothetical protein A2X56_12980 [Nitrospirae bacterium GWC2_57_13]|nr:MAG: hypothetical protein A2X56_12980 [Nitrospirae bacterium GWC2_57_13]
MALQTPARQIRGFSLIELMIAVVLIMVSMLAMLTSTLMSISTNLENDVRNTAIRVTNQTAEALLALPIEDNEFTDGSDHVRIPGNALQNAKGFPSTTVTVRGYQQSYTIRWTVVSQTENVKEVAITVDYTFKTQPRTNTAVIYKHKAI